MKKIYILIFILSCFQTKGQTLDNVYKNQKIGLEFQNTYVAQEYARYSSAQPGEPSHIMGVGLINFSFNTFNLTYRHQKNEVRGIYINFTNTKIGDIIASNYYELMTTEYEKVELINDWLYTNGYLGEINLGKTLYVSKDKKFNISSGVLVSDVVLRDDFYDVGGTHLMLGAFANFDKMVLSKYILRVAGYYGESALYFNGNNPEYRRPFNYRAAVELINNNGWYTGIGVRGVYNSYRSTINIGYRFSGKALKGNIE